MGSLLYLVLQLHTAQIEEAITRGGWHHLETCCARGLLQGSEVLPLAGWLRDEEQPERLQGAVGLREVILPVASHEGEAEDGCAKLPVLEGSVCHVAFNDALINTHVVQAHHIMVRECVAQQALTSSEVANPEVGTSLKLSGYPEGGDLGPALASLPVEAVVQVPLLGVFLQA